MLIGNPNLLQLLHGVRDGGIVLPDIQRSFVWDPDQIQLFCDSLFRGYPFGSFLFWRVIGAEDPQKAMVYRPFQSDYRNGRTQPASVDLAPREEKLLVLDGQQRLQSSFLSFFGHHEGRDLYLDVLTGKHEYDRTHDLKFYVRFYKESELDGFYSLPAGRGRRMVRIKDFLELDEEAVEKFAHRKADDLESEDKYGAAQKVRRVWSTLRNPNRVQMHIIDQNVHDLADATSLTEVAEIFVRVNSGGTRLSRSELVFTLLKSRWKEASEEFQALCDSLNSSGEFETDTDFVIKSLLVLSGYSSRVNIERMRDENIMLRFKEIFPRAKAAIESAFDFLTDSGGGAIRTYRLLTSGQRADRGYNVLIPLALYFYLRPKQEVPETQRRRLRRYLYTVIFSRYLVVYVESHLDKLSKVVREAHANDIEPFPLDDVEAEIKEWAPYQSLAEFFGRSTSLDPLLNILHGGQVQFTTLNSRNAPQRDHIFPQHKLRGRGVPEEQINHYANMRLVGAIENILKSDQDPDVALSSYSEEVLRDDYLIPKGSLRYDAYGQFLAERTELIREAVDRFLNG